MRFVAGRAVKNLDQQLAQGALKDAVGGVMTNSWIESR
jgi:hypothetical protein